jgi:hypothetical protein
VRGEEIARVDFGGPVDALTRMKRARSVETRLYSAKTNEARGFLPIRERAVVAATAGMTG